MMRLLTLVVGIQLLTGGVAVRANRVVTVPAGTVIPLRMETYLSSESSRSGDSFTATVFRDVEIDRWAAIPQASKIEGHVTQVTRAERRSKAGTIGVAFDRLILVDGESIRVDGTLTTLDDEARKKLEADEEGRVEGDSQKRRAVIFIGGGAGAGAVIGAIAGGGKGAAVGAGVGAVLGTIGTLLGKGDDAEVKPGTEFGMLVERAFSVDVESTGAAGQRFEASAETIRSVQGVLRDRGYYSGTIDGRMGALTRNAIRQFQRDQRLQMTGELDLATAQALGVTSQTGGRTELVSILNPRAEWVGRDSVRIHVDAYTEGGGWQVFADHFARGDTLHVYVRGVRPRLPGTTARDHHSISETINDVQGITRAVFHGAERETTVELTRGETPTSGETGDPRQISLLAGTLLEHYQRDLNVRSWRNQLSFDPRRDYKQGEIDLLSQLTSLAAAADFYSKIVGQVRDDDAVRDGADAMLRQARFVTRLLRRAEGWNVSRLVQNDWERLRSELRRITVVSNDLDTDIDRIR